MNANPGYWQEYYSGTDEEIRQLKIFSYSDRIRYYWTDTKVSEALDKMIASLNARSFPETVVSQVFMELEFGDIATSPNILIERQVARCIVKYFKAAGH